MRLHIRQAVVVEGKYDKIRLDSVIDAYIVVCDGFGIFKQAEKAALLRRLAKERGLIVLTDPDSGGGVIRSHLRSVLGKEGVTHLYVPAIEGKEKRKNEAGKDGLLGVEGIDNERLYALFLPFAGEAAPCASKPLTKADFYSLGLSGGAKSGEKRAALCRYLDLPPSLSANALLEAVNLLCLSEKVLSFTEETTHE